MMELQTKELATQQKTMVDNVATKIRELTEKKQINFPADYSPENALKSFWLILQSTKNSQGATAIETCDKNSIMNAMLDMCLQGLSPAKKQCYPIIYGNQLQLQRSYFGTQAVAYRVLGAKMISAQCIHDGDNFEFDTVDGIKVVTKHKQSLSSLDGKIIGAYCVVKMKDDSVYCEIMTHEQIMQSWKQSKMNPVNQDGSIKNNTVHSKFETEMAKKTVINRTLKSLINSSCDNDLVIGAFNRTTEAEYKEEIEIVPMANSKQFNKKPEMVTVEAETGEEIEADTTINNNPFED